MELIKKTLKLSFISEQFQPGLVNIAEDSLSLTTVFPRNQTQEGVGGSEVVNICAGVKDTWSS